MLIDHTFFSTLIEFHDLHLDLEIALIVEFYSHNSLRK